jgi:hypothetical protein
VVYKNNNNNGHPWLDDETQKDDMKILSATELSVLRRFIKDVLETINYDDTGVTLDLEDGALASAEILDIVMIDPYLEDDDGQLESDEDE